MVLLFGIRLVHAHKVKKQEEEKKTGVVSVISLHRILLPLVSSSID